MIYDLCAENIFVLLEPVVSLMRKIAQKYKIETQFSDDEALAFINHFFLANQETLVNGSFRSQLLEFLNGNRIFKFDNTTTHSDQQISDFFIKIGRNQNLEPTSKNQSNIIETIRRFDKYPDISDSASPEMKEIKQTLVQYVIYDIMFSLFNETFEYRKADEQINRIYLDISEYSTNNQSSIAHEIAQQLDIIFGGQAKDHPGDPNYFYGLYGINYRLINFQNEFFKDDTNSILYPTLKQAYVVWLTTTKDGRKMQSKLTGLDYPLVFDLSACGTGKSASMMWAILFSRPKVHFMLVENANFQGMQAEAQKYGIKVVKMRNMSEIAQITNQDFSSSKVLVMGTYENVSNLDEAEFNTLGNQINKLGKVGFFGDEAHRLKTGNIKRSQKFAHLFRPEVLDICYFATATPMTVSPRDLSTLLGLGTGVQAIEDEKSYNTHVLKLRERLIKDGLLVAQRSIPDSVELPIIFEKQSEIVIDLQAVEGVNAFCKLVEEGLFSAGTAQLFTRVKLFPEYFGLQYSCDLPSFREKIMEAAKNQTKVIIYTDYTNNGSIISDIYQSLLQFKDDNGNNIVNSYDIVVFTGENEILRYAELQKFIQKTSFGICIASSPISTSVNGLQGQIGVPNSAVRDMWVLNSPHTNAQLEQLIGRLHRAHGENAQVTINTPKIVFVIGDKRVSLEELKHQILKYRGGLPQILFYGNLKQTAQPPDQDSLSNYFRRLLFNAGADFLEASELGQYIAPLQKLKWEKISNSDRKFNENIRRQFSSGADLGEISFDDWSKYHRHRAEQKKSWPQIPDSFIRQIFIDKVLSMQNLSQEYVKVAELGPGISPIFPQIELSKRIDLPAISYAGFDLFQGFQEYTSEEIASQLNDTIDELKTQNTIPLDKLRNQNQIDSLDHILRNLDMLKKHEISFRVGDYRQFDSYGENLDFIFSCLSWYTWDSQDQLELIQKLVNSLRVGGELVLVVSKNVLFQVQNNNARNLEIIQSNLLESGMTPSNFFDNTTHPIIFSENLQGFSQIPSTNFIAISFQKNI